MNTFLLDTQKEYIIYGAGGNCFKLITLLRKQGCFVKYIVDKRAESIKNIDTIPVISLEDMRIDGVANKVVMISIKNVFEHTEIAKCFLKKGISQLIYKPLPILYGMKNEGLARVSAIYEKIVEQGQWDASWEVPIAEITQMDCLTDRIKIREQEDEVYCWLPVELLFNYDTEDAYGKIHMAALYPLVNLYQYLLGSTIRTWEEIQQDYFLYSANWVKENNLMYTVDLKRSQMDSRVKIFQSMQKDAEINGKFFEENAVAVAFGKKGIFYCKSSGRNRVAFLIAKGNNYIPVKMHKVDYQQWINTVEQKELEKFLRENMISSVFTTIPHPFFRDYPAKNIDYTRLFCMPIVARILRELHWECVVYNDGYARVDVSLFCKKKKNLNVCVHLEDEGTCSRILASEGIRCYSIFCNDFDNELSKKIDRLLFSEREETISENYTTDIAYSISHILITESYEEFKIKKFNGKFVFLLDKAGNGKVESYIRDNFQIEQKIFSSIWENQSVSGYVLRRE